MLIKIEKKLFDESGEKIFLIRIKINFLVKMKTNFSIKIKINYSIKIKTYFSIKIKINLSINLKGNFSIKMKFFDRKRNFSINIKKPCDKGKTDN